MYDERIEQLINAALADGVLTEKEKQILFKRAQEQGIDLDEFEMVLDARLVELQKAEKEKAEKSAPKSTKFGDVRKCPACGAMIGSFVMTCPECGFEFINVGPNQYVLDFSKRLEEELDKASENAYRHTSFLSDIDPTCIISDAEEKRYLLKMEKNFVESYPMPMTKEDCVEMLNYILPKIKANPNKTTKTWKNKYDAILKKLELDSSNNKKVLQLVESYREQGYLSGFKKFMIWFKSISLIAKVGLVFGLFFAIRGLIALIALICLPFFM